MSKERRSFDLEKRIPAPVSFMDSVGLCANAHSIQAFPYLISEEGDRVPAMLGIRLVKNTGWMNNKFYKPILNSYGLCPFVRILF